MEEIESGFVGEGSEDGGISVGMTDVEVLSATGINIIARGRRFGRFWLLKGLIPQLSESPSARRRLQKEFDLHSRLLNPNIVRVEGLENIPAVGLCIVEEWVEGETLATLLRDGDLSKSDRRRILREIITAVGYLHSKGVIHRDLKPQNIMVRKNGGEVVLIDFGLADSDDYAELKQGAGSKGYISPEQLKEGGARMTDDIYSLGVIMRELCPEYSRIANRCTGSLDKRPKDTASLLKMLDQTDRRPKLMAWGVAAAVLVAAVAVGSMHVRSISAETAEVRVQIDTLTNTNARNAARVDDLENLLLMATGRMNAVESAVSVSNKDRGMSRRSVIDAYRKMEKEIITFDRERVPYIHPDSITELRDSVRALSARCDKIALAAYDLKRFPELAPADSLMLTVEVKGLYEQLLSVYYTVWMAHQQGRKVRERRLDPHLAQ